MKNETKEERERRNHWYVSGHSELHSSEWFGAIFRYLISYGKKDFNSIYIEEESRKNVLTGWVIKILFLIVVIAIMITVNN